MKKKILLPILMLTSLNAHADNSGQKQYARNVSGGEYDKHGNVETPAHTCFYTVLSDAQNGYPDSIRAYLNSDTSANFSISVPKSELPLQEGAKFQSGQYQVSYQHGALTAKYTDWDYGRDVTEVTLKVSPDLSQITEGSGTDSVGNLIRQLTVFGLDCKF